MTGVIASMNWTVSQIAFIGGDFSANSMSQGNRESIYRHCVRLTNYSNAFDEVVQLSNVNHAGLAPRVGRVGLPGNTPSQAVNVELIFDLRPARGEYYREMIKERAPKTLIGIASRSWPIGDPDLHKRWRGHVERRSRSTGHFDTQSATQ
jgi:hypothetical protein